MKKSFVSFSCQLTIILSCIILSACQLRSREGTSNDKADLKAILSDSAHISPQYAKCFKVKYLKNGIRLVDIYSDDHSQAHSHHKAYHIALIPRGVKAENIPGDYQDQVEVPIRSCIPMGTEYLSSFIALNALDKVSGIASTHYLQNKTVKRLVKEGKIVRIGYEGSFDPEVVMEAHPDIIFISPFKRGGYDVLKQTGITLVPYLGFKEPTALGQAEWIKFFAMFIGKEKAANDYFRQVVSRYNKLKALAAKATTKPTVFSGENKDGEWFVMGGKSFLAGLFRDAGATYIPENDHHTGGYPSDFEEMYDMAANADYWRIMNNYPGSFSYKALQAADIRNTKFKAFKEKHVVYCNMRTSAYHELAPLHPDQLLADFVYAFHPELMKNYHPKFYAILK